MIVYPAIDLRGGKVVRLQQGDPNRQLTFSDDPLATAQQWRDEGAEWIHMVNLDGAFTKANDNLRILERVATLGVRVQFGGGLRSLAEAQEALNAGAARVVLGTLAVQAPQQVAEAVERFGAEAVCVALDARDGKIAIHGWQEQTTMTPTQFGREMAARGVVHALYTDIKRDGSLLGVNIHDTIALAHSTGLQVIASGGVSRMAEIHQLAQSEAVAGVIIGRALYEGKLTLAEALMAARGGLSDAG